LKKIGVYIAQLYKLFVVFRIYSLETAEIEHIMAPKTSNSINISNCYLL